MEEYKKRNAVVLGVNPGKLPSHQKFDQKGDFGFPLIVDENWKLAHAYGISHFWGIVMTRTVMILDGNRILRFRETGNIPTERLLQELDRLN